MNRKGFTIAILCMLVLLAACGRTGNKANGDSKLGEYSASQEILEAEWYSGLIQINDKVIELPVSFNELLDMGFDYQIDKGRKNKDYLFAQWETASYDLMLDGKKVFSQSLYYEEEELATLEQINPEIEYISGSEEETEGIVFFLPGGLTLGDAMAEVEEKLGEADETETQYGILTYTYGVPIKSSYEACEFGVYVEVDRNTQTVSEFRTAKNVAASKLEDFVELDMKNVIEDYTNFTVQVLFPKEHLVYGNDVSTDYWSALVEIDGDVFELRLQPSVYTKENFDKFQDSNQRAHVLLYEDTDKNGVVRKVYDGRGEYIFGEIYCFSGSYVLQARVNLTPYSNKDADVAKAFEAYMVDLGKMIDFNIQ